MKKARLLGAGRNDRIGRLQLVIDLARVTHHEMALARRRQEAGKIGPVVAACIERNDTGKAGIRGEAACPKLLPEAALEETVLVLEDDEDVRSYSVEILRELGYRVLEARDGPAALRVLDQQPRVDLLFTDVVLPANASDAVTWIGTAVRTETSCENGLNPGAVTSR